MRFPFAPRVWLLLGLLLLTLMQVAVYGIIPMEMHQSPGDQSRTSQQKAQGNVQAEEDQQLESMIRDEEPIVDVIDTTPWNKKHMEEGAEEKSHWVQERISKSRVENYTPVMNRCQKWFSCSYHFYIKLLKSLQNNLPSCPCTYIPEARERVVSLFDQGLGRTFYWKSTNNTEEKKNDYHPSAGRCLRSLREENSTSMASQVCCYNANGCLFTRGKWVGFPQLISPDFAPKLHFKVDRDPWNFCERDWTLFHFIFPPNNGLSCPQRPSNAKYGAQFRKILKN